MRVLFVAHPMTSHIAPLVALARRIRNPRIESAFLLSRTFHAFGKRLGVRVLDIDRRLEDGVRPDMTAVGTFRPTVIVDDLSATTALVARMAGLPHVSIMRKGLFPGDTQVAQYAHSSQVEKYFSAVKAMNLKQKGIWEPDQITDLFVGNLNLIPSCAEIEVLPSHLRSDPAYRYVGPLLLEDEEILASMQLVETNVRSAGAQAGRVERFPVRDRTAIGPDLNRFLAANRDRKIIYFTIGFANPDALYARRSAVVRALLDTQAAVISNIDAPEIRPEERERHFAAPYLPMNRTCSACDLAIHHCGSGAYAYQLLHRRPAIILGTQSVDRDSVGARLAALGAAQYFPAEELDTDAGLRRFRECVDELLAPGSTARSRQVAAIEELRASLRAAQSRFDFAQALEALVARN